MYLYRFGIRSVPPCDDCWEDGVCSMNCGPAKQKGDEDVKLDQSKNTKINTKNVEPGNLSRSRKSIRRGKNQ